MFLKDIYNIFMIDIFEVKKIISDFFYKNIRLPSVRFLVNKKSMKRNGNSQQKDDAKKTPTLMITIALLISRLVMLLLTIKQETSKLLRKNPNQL